MVGSTVIDTLDPTNKKGLGKRRKEKKKKRSRKKGKEDGIPGIPVDLLPGVEAVPEDAIEARRQW